ncbi:MAG: 4Fe-4S cluster-binding domain-containing protein [Elusimicrobiota bacterium]
MDIKKISVILGKKCGFYCSHCNSINLKRNLLAHEKKRIISEINIKRFKKILFAGGEPFFYVKDINEILSGIKDLSSKTIELTTNGYFASTEKKSEKYLKSILKLDSVQMSYDKFHYKFLPYKNIKNLYKACRNLHIKFGIVIAVSEFADLLLIKKIRKYGKFFIGIQKVLPIGNAIKNKLYFRPVKFDETVLKKSCPSKKEISYIAGKGFSVCCSNLSYNDSSKIKTYHHSLNRHMKSKFYGIISNFNFQDIIRKYYLDIPANKADLSLECNLCEYIFSRIKL